MSLFKKIGSIVDYAYDSKVSRKKSNKQLNAKRNKKNKAARSSRNKNKRK